MNTFKEALVTYAHYFEELRTRLLRLTKIFIFIFAAGFFATTPVIRFVLARVHIAGVTIVTTSPFQLVDLAMSVGFFSACIVTIPIFVYDLYRFLRPGLLPKERYVIAFLMPFGVVLFLVGFVYGCGMLYFATKLIAQVNVGLGVANYWDISTFISQMVLTSSLLGILFMFPLVISFFIRIGVMTTAFLRSKRRHAIVIIFIIVSLLPPTDGLSLVLMSAPLVLIYEITILLNREKRS